MKFRAAMGALVVAAGVAVGVLISSSSGGQSTAGVEETTTTTGGATLGPATMWFPDGTCVRTYPEPIGLCDQP